MEIEYKWNLPDDGVAKGMLASDIIAGAVAGSRTIDMRATYFDTPAQDVYALHGGLRIRRENDRSICCLKLSAHDADDCKTRREYEVEAADIIEGLEKLPNAGAPEDVCARFIAGGPKPTCETVFSRKAYELAHNDFRAELAIDLGELRHDGKVASIHEIELEFAGGSEEAFHEFAHELQRKFSLEPQPLSKLARAITL